MDLTALSLSNVFDGADQWGEILTLLPVLIVLEIVLFADNAVALAAIARSSQNPVQERLALNIGIGLALVLRLGLIVVAQWVLQNIWRNCWQRATCSGCFWTTSRASNPVTIRTRSPQTIHRRVPCCAR